MLESLLTPAVLISILSNTAARIDAVSVRMFIARSPSFSDFTHGRMQLRRYDIRPCSMMCLTGLKYLFQRTIATIEG